MEDALLEFNIDRRSYEMYYDESNNGRVFYIREGGFNTDDGSYRAQPIFVLAGIALTSPLEPSAYEELVCRLRLQASANELKFAQLVKLKRSFGPGESFKRVMGSSRILELLKWIEEKGIHVHCFALNAIYWSFIDLVDDLIMFQRNPEEIQRHWLYKSALYEVIRHDRDAFLRLAASVQFPKIITKKARLLLNGIYELTVRCRNESSSKSVILKRTLDEFIRFLQRQKLRPNVGRKFLLSFNSHANKLIEDFSFCYLERLKTFPESKHTFDREDAISAAIERLARNGDLGAAQDFKFVNSADPENIAIQVSDVIAGIFRTYHAFLEHIAESDVERFVAELSTRELSCLSVFMSIVDRSVDECPLFWHRIVNSHDDHIGEVLLKALRLRFSASSSGNSAPGGAFE